jgi:hypothetical protein
MSTLEIARSMVITALCFSPFITFFPSYVQSGQDPLEYYNFIDNYHISNSEIEKVMRTKCGEYVLEYNKLFSNEQTIKEINNSLPNYYLIPILINTIITSSAFIFIIILLLDKVIKCCRQKTIKYKHQQLIDTVND